MKRKWIILAAALLLPAILTLRGVRVSLDVKTKVKELFKMNKKLQEEGYYMADFEFKLMGIIYYLDKGRYKKGYSELIKYHQQLKNKENLIRMPEFRSRQEEYEFYLNLQNPKTGAFMDDSFPSCTYIDITENVLDHLDALANELDAPLKLKYPLTFLDEFNTPEKLTTFLDDVSHVSWLVGKFPQTPYFFARSIISYANDDGVFARNNLYDFNPEFRHTLLEWLYDSQDSITGFWGPRSRRNGKLMTPDLDNTAPIIKIFRNRSGHDIHTDFPLRHEQELIRTTLKVLGDPVPPDDETDEVHAWNLVMDKGISMLLRYVWSDMSDKDKQRTKAIIEEFIKIKFEKYYVSEEGAFSYYPGAKHASLDGTGSFIYKEIGALSSQDQQHLWGDYSVIIRDLGQHRRAILTEEDIHLVADNASVNSFRIYRDVPDYEDLTADVFAVGYPRSTIIQDITELYPKISRWISKHPNSMGNWKSRADVLNEYRSFDSKEPGILGEVMRIDSINRLFLKNREFYIIGFDTLQVPRYKVRFISTGEL